VTAGSLVAVDYELMCWSIVSLCTMLSYCLLRSGTIVTYWNVST